MKRKATAQAIAAVAVLLLFAAYTVSLKFVDVQPIGPEGSAVAYAGINGWVHQSVGVNWTFYNITDAAGIVTILLAAGFGVLGLWQWINRKSLRRVDPGILTLGAFFVLVFGTFAFFEVCRINYRPVLVEGVLEASYPSSTTMLALCVFPAVMIQFHRLIKNKPVRIAVLAACGLFTVFMVVGRIVAGVHWITDIFGGLLFSIGAVLLYISAQTHIQEAEK